MVESEPRGLCPSFGYIDKFDSQYFKSKSNHTAHSYPIQPGHSRAISNYLIVDDCWKYVKTTCEYLLSQFLILKKNKDVWKAFWSLLKQLWNGWETWVWNAQYPLSYLIILSLFFVYNSQLNFVLSIFYVQCSFGTRQRVPYNTYMYITESYF